MRVVLAVCDWLGDSVADSEGLGDMLRDCVSEAVCVGDCDREAVSLGEPLELRVPVAEGVPEDVFVPLWLGVCDCELDWLRVPLALGVPEIDGDGVDV